VSAEALQGLFSALGEDAVKVKDPIVIVIPPPDSGTELSAHALRQIEDATEYARMHGRKAARRRYIIREEIPPALIAWPEFITTFNDDGSISLSVLDAHFIFCVQEEPPKRARRQKKNHLHAALLTWADE
jgi:hypothetical protein